MKICKNCLKEKDKSLFNNHSIMTDGKSSICRKCSKEKSLNFYRSKEGLILKIYSNQKASSKKRGHHMPLYSKLELQKFIFSHTNFENLYNNWVDSNYNKDYAPSIDRLNDYLPYSFDNIQLISWKQNNSKHHSDRKNNINTKINKKVYQYSKDLKLINIFNSTMEAQRITSISNTEIGKCCRNLKNYNTAGGFIWKYIPF